MAAGCSALPSATPRAKPAPRTVSGSRPRVRARGRAARPAPKATARLIRPRAPAAGRQARPSARPSRRAWPTNSTASVESARATVTAAAATSRPLPAAARRRKPTTGGGREAGGEGGEGERLQEDVRVQRREGEAPKGIGAAGGEAPRSPRPELA